MADKNGQVAPPALRSQGPVDIIEDEIRLLKARLKKLEDIKAKKQMLQAHADTLASLRRKYGSTIKDLLSQQKRLFSSMDALHRTMVTCRSQKMQEEQALLLRQEMIQEEIRELEAECFEKPASTGQPSVSVQDAVQMIGPSNSAAMQADAQRDLLPSAVGHASEAAHPIDPKETAATDISSIIESATSQKEASGRSTTMQLPKTILPGESLVREHNKRIQFAVAGMKRMSSGDPIHASTSNPPKRIKDSSSDKNDGSKEDVKPTIATTRPGREFKPF